jgi:hypothetical protein
LQQGHNPGKYASMLRDILRKMSKDDSHVRLKSLEQVLKLGQDIVQQDQEEKLKKQQQQQLQQQHNSLNSPINSPVSLPTSPIMANMHFENNYYKSSGMNNNNNTNNINSNQGINPRMKSSVSPIRYSGEVKVISNHLDVFLPSSW